jgi:hypothetical protein
MKAGTVAYLAAMLTGCENMPGTKEQQGAVIGGASGAAVGAVIGGEKNRVLGAVLGGALGAAGGYVIAANKDKILGKDSQAADEAARKSQERPATAEDARNATTADLNADGFVTLDEVVALKQAGFTDSQMLDRLRATDQVFDLTDDQKEYLQNQGVSRRVVDQMAEINREQRQQILNERRDVIGQPQTRQAN